MSVSEQRPDLEALRELEQLIRALGDEMAGWRRRAHEAEARLKEVESSGVRAAPSGNGSSALEAENRELRRRLEAARERTRALLDRLRFLRQQHESEAER